MHRCVCSTRALDTFVRDLTGIKVRQQRAQVYFQHCRPLTTRSSLRQSQSALHQSADNIAEPTQREEKVVTRDKLEATTTGEIRERGGRTISDIALTEANDALAKSAVESPGSASEPRTRVQSRVLRKLRRMEDGTYAPSARQGEEQAEKGADEEREAQMQNVLKKIDELEGPSVVQQEQRRKQTLAEKSLEKRKRRQVAAAQKKREEAEKSAHEEAERERYRKKGLAPWQRDKEALAEKFKDVGWQPRKRLSPDSLEGIRALHASDPATYTTPVLADHFQVSVEGVRRILKSKWQPSEDERAKRMERWERRGVRKWEKMSSEGMKPPKKWRMLGVKNPKVESKKKWEDRVRARERAIQFSEPARDKDAWREELKRASTYGEVVNLADRII